MSNAAVDALVEHRRAEWWHGAPRRPLTPVVHPYAEVHHSGAASHYGKNPALVLEQIETQHRARGWNGAFYGLFVPTDGSLWEARGVGWRSIGDHAARYDDGTLVDPDALCVLLPGDYRTNEVTAAQEATLDRIRASLPDRLLRWHGMRKPFTECPGTHAIETLRTINARPPGAGEPTAVEEDDDMLLLIKEKGTDPVFLTDFRYRWPVTTQARMDILTSPLLGNPTVPGPVHPWHEWTRAEVEDIPLAPSALNAETLAAAIAKRLPPGTPLDPNAIAAEVVDEIAGRLAG